MSAPPALPTSALAVEPHHQAELLRLLGAHLPGIEVWACGSRVQAASTRAPIST